MPWVALGSVRQLGRLQAVRVRGGVAMATGNRPPCRPRPAAPRPDGSEARQVLAVRLHRLCGAGGRFHLLGPYRGDRIKSGFIVSGGGVCPQHLGDQEVQLAVHVFECVGALV